MQNVANLVDQLLQSDVETAQREAAAESPSLQREMLLECMQRLPAVLESSSSVRTVLGVMQSLLAGSYSLLSEKEAVEWLPKLVDSVSATDDDELQGQCITICALVANRIRDVLVPEATVTAILSLRDNAKTPRIERIASVLDARIRTALERRQVSVLGGSRTFSIPDIDFRASATNVKNDARGDWYQDPWGWPEFDWLAANEFKLAVDRAGCGDVGWTVPIDVAKKHGGIRPAIVMNPLDRLVYQALVDDLSGDAIAEIPDWVFGWRLDRNAPKRGAYINNSAEWKAYRRRVVDLCGEFAITAHLDIHSFFSSVDTSALIAQLARSYRKSSVLDRLETYFENWHQSANGSGIPQRCLASSVLAHAVLRPLDTYLDRVSKGSASESIKVTRWMDDIWIYGSSDNTVQQCVREIEAILGQIRLSLNSEKTAIFESNDAGVIVQLVDDSSGDENASSDDSWSSPERILQDAEDAPLFTISLAIEKMIRANNFSALEKLTSDQLARWTYAADRFAKALRVSGQWEKHVDWYVAFTRQHISAESWSVAAWGEMFPNRAKTNVSEMYQFFSEQLLGSAPRILTPLAAQRLSSWRDKFGPDSILDASFLQRVGSLGDVFRFRGVCFAALEAGVDKADVHRIANDFGDQDTLALLKDLSFSAPPLSERFAAE